jgi:hypothetical protein
MFWDFMGPFMNSEGPIRDSEHGLICHLFELILVILANTSNETNHNV